MIIDKEYDKFLWIILKVDKKNRQRIIEFIKSVPKPIFDGLEKSIEMYRKYEQDDMIFLDEMNLTGLYETHNRLLYWYEIEKDFGTLEIGYSVFTGKKYEDAFSLSLELDSILSEDNYEECIGSIRYDISEEGNTTICNEVEYNLIDGRIVVSSLDGRNDKHRIRLNFINLDNIPEEIFITDYTNNKKKKLCKRLG